MGVAGPPEPGGVAAGAPGTPLGKPVRAGLKMSLLPIHTVAKVGFASSAFCTSVLPPRIICCSAPLVGFPVAAVGSNEVIPGTATLFRTGVMLVGVRK